MSSTTSPDSALGDIDENLLDHYPSEVVLGGVLLEIHRYAREADDAFPGFRVIVHYEEADLRPSIGIYSTHPFDENALERLGDFAADRGLRLKVGGDGGGGLALHVAVMSPP